jgi:cyclase
MEERSYASLGCSLTRIARGFAEGPGKLKFVLNTHFHGDHTGSNPVFGPEATIVAQDNVRKRLVSGATIMGNKVEPMAPAGLPVVTYAETVSVHLNGEEIKAIHVPHGHTDGNPEG